MKIFKFVFFIIFFTSPCFAGQGEYDLWLQGTKKNMVERGVSQKTVDKAFVKNYYNPKSEILKSDKKQLEFSTTSVDYLNRIINQNRVKKAREKYKELYPLHKDIEKKYGVGFHYLIAFWAVETNFGQTFGNHEVIEALTVLAYDKRRRKFFTEELYQALKIMDNYELDCAKMQGSWAGAMGHFQFMPSTFNNYAVDYDDDEVIDIWDSFKDASASAANYLSEIGWDEDLKWGAKISLPKDFDYSRTGRNKFSTIKKWRKLGVKIPNDFDNSTQAAIIIPEGKTGQAYLITNNFKKIMQWNHSENYALAIGILADYIKNNNDYKKLTNKAPRLKTKDVETIQAFINKKGWDKIKEDGQLGPKTREAIQTAQKKLGLPQDGYPDDLLLKKIKDYSKK